MPVYPARHYIGSRSRGCLPQFSGDPEVALVLPIALGDRVPAEGSVLETNMPLVQALVRHQLDGVQFGQAPKGACDVVKATVDPDDGGCRPRFERICRLFTILPMRLHGLMPSPCCHGSA